MSLAHGRQRGRPPRTPRGSGASYRRKPRPLSPQLQAELAGFGPDDLRTLVFDCGCTEDVKPSRPPFEYSCGYHLGSRGDRWAA